MDEVRRVDTLPYIGLEHETVAITSFSMYYIPALLQTGDYARAIIKAIESKVSPYALDQRIEVTLRRQELLERDTPPRYWALLDEAVLHRQIGGPEVMRTQLDRILRSATNEHTTMQVISFDAGAHASPDSNFVILEFGEGSEQWPVVFVEGLTTNLYQERPAEIARYREAFENLRDAALSPRESMRLIS